MTKTDDHLAARRVIDRVVVPAFGLHWALGGGAMALAGRVRFNGRELSYAREPGEFAMVVGACFAVALLCIGWGVVRGLIDRRRSAKR